MRTIVVTAAVVVLTACDMMSEPEPSNRVPTLMAKTAECDVLTDEVRRAVDAAQAYADANARYIAEREDNTDPVYVESRRLTNEAKAKLKQAVEKCT